MVLTFAFKTVICSALASKPKCYCKCDHQKLTVTSPSYGLYYDSLLDFTPLKAVQNLQLTFNR